MEKHIKINNKRIKIKSLDKFINTKKLHVKLFQFKTKWNLIRFTIYKKIKEFENFSQGDNKIRSENSKEKCFKIFLGF